MQTSRIAPWALVVVAAMWGISFVMMKPAIAQQPFFDFLAIRFTIAAAIMLIARPQVLKLMTGKMLVRGGILGAILGVAYIAQTIALEMTTAAITGFLTGLYVVLTPVFGWLFFRKKIGLKVGIGAILAVIGLGFITISEFAIEVGQIWGILCAALYAIHIVGLGKWSPGLNSYALTFVQLVAVAIICWIGALPNGYQPPPNTEVWMAVLFTAIFATVIGFFVQTWAQGQMEPSRVAIILTLEVVFTAVFSVAVGQEVLALKTIIGGLFVISAMLIVEWPKKNKAPDDDEIVPLEPMAH